MTASVVDAGDGLPLTVPALLRERAARRADHAFLVCDDEVLTYGEAASRSAALAKGLLACGAGRGTHVGLLYPNGADFAVGSFAAARIGAVALPLSTFSTSNELRTLLRNADIEVLLAVQSFRARDYVADLHDAVAVADLAEAPLYSASVPALRRVVFDPAAAVAAGAGADDAVLASAEAQVRPSDRLVIVHTSGSTSEPKGVIHQHGPLLRHLDNLNALRGYTEDEVLFSNSPFFWIGGYAYSFVGTLLAGATLGCSNATEPTATLDLLERVRPTMVNGFAATVAHLVKDPSFAVRDLRSIRRGNLWPIMPPDIRPADPELRHNMLGMTETGSVCLASEDEGEQPEHRRGSFGRPVPGFEARIVDAGTGATCATGEVGELWLRSPFLMEGYYGRERHETFTPDGWFRTGDLFHVDGEGFFYFTGRSGDMIKTGGANVSPREVEAAIAEITGLVAHVIGIDDPEGAHAGLDAESRARASALVAAGVGKGARVGLLAPNGIDWAVTALAALRIGAVLVPLSTLLRPSQLEAQLNVAGVTHLVLAPSSRGRSYADDLDVIAPGVVAATRNGHRHARLPWLRHVWAIDDLPAASAPASLVAALEDAVRPADDLAILFTSGSRGAPKGTVHTHGGGLRAVAAGLNARCIGAGERVYIPMPYFWTGGFSSDLLSVLVAGATLLTEAVPDPGRTLELLVRERATLFRGWPDQAAQLAADPRFASSDLSSLGPGSLPAVLPAGQRPSPGARANLFGMTETFGPYCGDRLDRDLPEEKRGSCGRPFDGFDVRVVDPASGAGCAPGATGEVRVRGPNVMRAICGRTRDTTFDADGYYPTGDLGSLDGDGYLWYHGRLDDMFKVRGATVYPAEVEAVLRCVPGVQQAHVTNVAADDGTQAVGALVVSAVPLEDLAAHARAHLSAFKVPTRWVLTGSADAVPLTGTAKVDRGALQGLLTEGTRT